MLRIGIGLLVIILSTANVSAAPYLVKDINPFPGVGARPRGLTQMNGALFFEACGDVWYDEEEDHFAPTDCELWKSDGTAEGTNRVKDIFPGSGSSQPLRLTAMNGRLFFRACDPDSGCELWSSDGTEEGTRRVADINPGPADGLPDTDGELSILNGTLLFWACEPVGGCEPWKSDGTEAGTVRIADINPGPGGSRGIYGAYRAWTVLNGQLFFDASEPSGGQELWKTDGTTPGTARVADINPGPGDSVPEEFTGVNGTLFFTAQPRGFVAAGKELWKTDGSDAGTVSVVAGADMEYLTAVDDDLYFLGWGYPGIAVWKSDGSAQGTNVVAGIEAFGGAFMIPTGAINHRLLVYSDDLWTTDGTPTGTVRLPSSTRVIRLGFANGLLYFVSGYPADSLSLWRSDGTVAGTRWVADLGTINLFTTTNAELVELGGTFFFTATSDETGEELWALRVTDPEPLDRQTSTTSTSTSTSTSSSTVVMASTTTSTSTTATPPVASTTTTTLSRSCGSSDIPRVIGRRLGRAYNLITMSGVRAHERTRWRVRKALRLVRVAELHLGTVRDLAPECREAIRRCADDIRTVTKASLVEYRDGTRPIRGHGVEAPACAQYAFAMSR